MKKKLNVAPGTVFATDPRMSKADELQARMEIFVDAVIEFLEPIAITAEAGRFISQLAGSSTSVGADYRAARRARSHAEFTAKIGVVSEESDSPIAHAITQSPITQSPMLIAPE